MIQYLEIDLKTTQTIRTIERYYLVLALFLPFPFPRRRPSTHYYYTTVLYLHPPPSSQSQLNEIVKMRTDGVVNRRGLKVARRVNGGWLLPNLIGNAANNKCAPLFSHAHVWCFLYTTTIINRHLFFIFFGIEGTDSGSNHDFNCCDIYCVCSHD